MKIIFWGLVALIWAPFEIMWIMFTKEISGIGFYIAKKFAKS